MNIIDLLLFLIILLGAYSGYQKGFIIGTIELLLLASSLLVAFWFYSYLVLLFENYITSLGVWTAPLAFVLTYAFARILMDALAAKLIKRLPAKVNDHVLNKAPGLLPGSVKGIIYAAIISALLMMLPFFDGLSLKTRESAIANALIPHVEWAESKLAPVFDEAINHRMNHLTVSPHSKRSVDLSFTVQKPVIKEKPEAQMLDMINQERQKKGLSPLKADPEMREVARAHSQDMFRQGYFSHVDPDGGTLANRAHAKNVQFLVAGENLALAPSLQIAHSGLMNSPGHRANILNPSFGRVGIGIMDGGKHGLMITQNFRN